MELKFIYFNEIYINIYKTPFYRAVEKGNIEIVKLLLTNNNVDINKPCIYEKSIFIKF